MPDKLAVIQSEETVKELNLIDERVKGLVVTFKELVETGNKINSGLLKGTPKEFIQSEKELIALQKQKSAILKELALAEQKLAAISITNERARKEAANADKAELLLKQKQLQMAAQQEKAVNKMVSAYDQLNKKHIEARKAAMDLGVQYGITSKEFLEAAKIANQYDMKLKQIDSTLGKHNRNVGNYNNLQVQMSQVMREAPNFAIDPRIGIMSLTNNLPMLAEAIGEVSEKNKALKIEYMAAAAAAKEKAIADAIATGQSQKAAVALGAQAEAQMMANYQAVKGPGLLKQLAGALMSWQTLLIVGISLLMVYNKEIIAWTTNLFKGSGAAAMAAKSAKELNDIRKESVKTAAAEIIKLDILYRVAKNTTLSIEQRTRATDQLQKLYPSYFKNMTDEQIMLGKGEKMYLKLRDAILASSRARAAESLLSEKQGKLLESQNDATQDVAENMQKINKLNAFLASGQKRATLDMGMFSQDYTRDAAKRAIENIKEQNKTILNGVTKESKDFNKQYAFIMNQIAKDQQTAAPYEADKYGIDPAKEKTPRTKKGRDISKEDRDAIDLAIADRDNQIAKIKEQKLKMEITEKEYWERYITIQKNYRAKILQIINDDNARKKRISAQTRLKAITEIEKANKEIFDYEKAGMDAQRKLQEQNLENRMEFIKNDEYIMEVERIKQQNDVYNEMIANTDLFYQNLIEKAKKYGKEIINIEAERDTKIAEIQKNQMSSNARGPAAAKTDAEYYKQIEDSYRSAANAEQRRAIIANSRLNVLEKEFLLSLKEKEQVLESLKYEKEFLEIRQKELQEKKKLTIAESEELANIIDKVSQLNEKLAETEEAIKKIKMDKLREDWAGTLDFIAGGLSDLGFNNLANEVNNAFDEIIGKTFDWKDATILAAAAVTDALTLLNQKTLDNQIAALDEQLAHSQAATEKELEFIDGRLERLNALDELSKEQIAERNALEDEARVLKEQQLQREKMIASQKARAEQKASANQALINGFLAATKTLATLGIPAGIVPAAVAAAFGGLQAALIMSKNPVPQYFVGRKGGPEEIAWTQERGRELITNNGKIKSFGSDSGPTLTKLDAGDTVHTASETEKILANLETAKLGDNVYRKIARQKVAPIFIQKENIDYDKLADKIGDKFERGLKKYDKTAYFEDENGNVFSQQGGNIPVFRGKKKKTNIIISTPKNERN